jgi:hypothetical protein
MNLLNHSTQSLKSNYSKGHYFLKPIKLYCNLYKIIHISNIYHKNFRSLYIFLLKSNNLTKEFTLIAKEPYLNNSKPNLNLCLYKIQQNLKLN